MGELRIRLAEDADLAAIDDIYNHYVRTSTCTAQYEPTTPDERRTWFVEHAPELHPVTVAERDGRVVGWGAISRYHGRAGYRYTVENSVYVAPDEQRRGVGRALLDDLIVRARGAGHRTIIAAIAGDQAGSIALHARAGFVEVGRMRDVVVKLGQWLDVVYMQLML
jgi:phosphinothricin acetyltransferase